MTQEECAREFEALICEVQAIALEVEAMKVANKVSEYHGSPPAYGEGYFYARATDMKIYAEKFRNLGK